VFAWPGAQPPSGDTRLNGTAVPWDGAELRFHELPATIVVDGSP
jgi:hypothetical protein